MRRGRQFASTPSASTGHDGNIEGIYVENVTLVRILNKHNNDARIRKPL